FLDDVWPASHGRSSMEQSAGVSVKDTNMENKIAAADTTPKLNRYCPIVPVMNTTGRKITTSESVVAITARPISLVAFPAASRGDTPFSSTYRKIFSSTTMASSMTIPVASESASNVMLLDRKSTRLNSSHQII